MFCRIWAVKRSFDEIVEPARQLSSSELLQKQGLLKKHHLFNGKRDVVRKSAVGTLLDL